MSLLKGLERKEAIDTAHGALCITSWNEDDTLDHEALWANDAYQRLLNLDEEIIKEAAEKFNSETFPERPLSEERVAILIAYLTLLRQESSEKAKKEDRESQISDMETAFGKLLHEHGHSAGIELYQKLHQMLHEHDYQEK